MNTFLPYGSFNKSAKCLDMRRLGKQRVECLQILNALFLNKGWNNHPATKMWRNDINWLIVYGQVICQEWKSRGYKDSCEGKINKFVKHLNSSNSRFLPPPWIDDSFCLAHQSNLIRKNAEFYRPIFGDVPDDIPYVWPV